MTIATANCAGEELRNDPRFGALKGYLGMVDTNKNGTLDMVELTRAPWT